MLTEKQIELLEKQGAKRWIKGDYDRLYVNGWNLPGVTTNWKKGGKKTVTINGEELSYTKSAIFGSFGAKNYIDVKTGEVFTSSDDRYYSEFILEALRSMIPEDK